MTEIKKYRGHIRNWRELCDELCVDNTLGRADREQEILKKSYEKWGEKCPEHLYGMFSFGLYNSDKDEIFCARDQFGTKPFYYYVTADNRLLYGTNISDIISQDGFVKELNEKILQIYMSLTYVGGEETFFKGLMKLMPGHFLKFKNGNLQIKRYFNPTDYFKPDESKTLEEWADEIHTTFGEIIPQVKENGEVAMSFLSGGVDSSYVLAMTDVKETGSCGYDDERFDESGLAKQTADILGRKNNRCLVTPEDYFSIVPFVMKNMEQPLGDASAIAFAIGCRETAKKTKLCYSGEGADEFFGGYNMYRNAQRYGENLPTFYVGNTNIMKEDEKKRLLKNYDSSVLPIDIAKGIYEETTHLDPLSKMSDVDIQIWLEGDIYLNVDKMSEAFGLEVRMPLTDRRIFEIAGRMPSRFKVNDEQNKVAFRTAAAKVLPEEIAFRKKLGFIVPIRIWLADERYNSDVNATLHSENANKFFNADVVEEIWQDYLGGNSDNWRKIWTIYTFLVWYREYFN